jgi:hypothetical protein
MLYASMHVLHTEQMQLKGIHGSKQYSSLLTICQKREKEKKIDKEKNKKLSIVFFLVQVLCEFI